MFFGVKIIFFKKIIYYHDKQKNYYINIVKNVVKSKQVINMTSGTIITLLGDFFIEHIKMTKPHNMPVQHYHDMYEIYLHTGGERGLFLDGIGSAQYFHLKKGDLVIIAPFVIHYTQSFEGKNYERYVMNFDPDGLSVILSRSEIEELFSDIHTSVIHLADDDYEKAYGFFKRADEYSKKKDKISAKLLYAELFQFIHYVGGISKNEKTPKENLAPEEVHDAMSYVKAHYKDDISLELILSHIHMSKSRFCYKFREFTGTSFMEYVYNVRTAQVHRLLLQTDKPLCEIAEETGFSSTAHMTRIFKKAYGMSPGNFRKHT